MPTSSTSHFASRRARSRRTRDPPRRLSSTAELSCPCSGLERSRCSAPAQTRTHVGVREELPLDLDDPAPRTPRSVPFTSNNRPRCSREARAGWRRRGHDRREEAVYSQDSNAAGGRSGMVDVDDLSCAGYPDVSCEPGRSLALLTPARAAIQDLVTTSLARRIRGTETKTPSGMRTRRLQVVLRAPQRRSRPPSRIGDAPARDARAPTDTPQERARFEDRSSVPRRRLAAVLAGARPDVYDQSAVGSSPVVLDHDDRVPQSAHADQRADEGALSADQASDGSSSCQAPSGPSRLRGERLRALRARDVVAERSR